MSKHLPQKVPAALLWVQVERAVETEVNTGPAKPPQQEEEVGAAAALAADTECGCFGGCAMGRMVGGMVGVVAGAMLVPC